MSRIETAVVIAYSIQIVHCFLVLFDQIVFQIESFNRELYQVFHLPTPPTLLMRKPLQMHDQVFRRPVYLQLFISIHVLLALPTVPLLLPLNSLLDRKVAETVLNSRIEA